MTDTLEQVSALLHEAGETHHRVFRIVDGADDDWASWYAWWLINLSELPDLLDAKPVRSELIYLLVSLDKHPLFTPQVWCNSAEAPGSGRVSGLSVACVEARIGRVRCCRTG